MIQAPSPWMNQRPPLDVNVAYVEGREDVDRGAANQPQTQVTIAMLLSLLWNIELYFYSFMFRGKDKLC
ncbi:hypothetical protein Hdeb2414_s0384g00881901 [Helianthus debilis subsp. tardiflorus]